MMSQSRHRVCTKEMAQGGGPSVFTVDTYGTTPPPVPPPVPPRPGSGRAESNCVMAHTVLFILGTIILCGLAVEAFFIYSLHQPKNQDNCAMFSSQTAGEDVVSAAKPPLNRLIPSKPAAHLTGGLDAHHGLHVMGWSVSAEHLLHEIDYIDNRLVIQKEGYYFIYSKVFFTGTGTFYHSVQKLTRRMPEESLSLLLARNYPPGSNKSPRQNSFLGGVFHLEKHDALFVNVTNTSNVEKYQAIDNVFGAFML